ncbi:MAG: hypothetical protein J6J17_00035 [Bacilli bacterium]|nr:hypothetical protein [Bacilli bacterium]
MEYYVDLMIKNNDEVIKKENIKAKYIENKELEFKYENESIKMTFNKDNIIMKKDNNESLIIFNFILKRKTDSKYFIKDLNFYIDTEIFTNELIIEKNKLYIEYELWLSNEKTGIFKYQIDIKEM